MAIYAKQQGFAIKITEAKKDVFTSDKGQVIESYYVRAVWDDPRLSSKLNGQPCFGYKMEKAEHALRADGGFPEIKAVCDMIIDARK